MSQQIRVSGLKVVHLFLHKHKEQKVSCLFSPRDPCSGGSGFDSWFNSNLDDCVASGTNTHTHTVRSF